MKAAVVRVLGDPLAIEDRPDPEPGPGQVRVRGEASGLCHTGIPAAHGARPVRPDPPFAPGREGVGLVEKPGDGGYAEKMPTWEDFAQPAPEGVTAVDVAPLTCDGVITYKALKAADVRPAQLVAISGIGGLGHVAAQYAKIVQAAVAAIDDVPRGQVKARIDFGLGAGR